MSVIFHIDLNAFFASCEEILEPNLVNKPIAVGGHNGVISCASYPARKLGVHSAMPTVIAKQKCPELIVLDHHMDFYIRLSHEFMEIIRSYTPLVQVASIDECYADMTEVISKYSRPLDLAFDLQKRVLKELNLKCSIGIAPNKFLAKMASDMKKPMGLTVLRKREVQQKLWPLKIEEMYGVGKKSAESIKKIGINTIGDLATYSDNSKLMQIFGKNTQVMIDRAWGISSSTLQIDQDIKSMSQSTTINQSVDDYLQCKETFYQLSKKLAYRLQQHKVMGNLITITLKDSKLKMVNKSVKLDFYLNDFATLYEYILDLFDQLNQNIPYRLLGISVSNLIEQKKAIAQIDIFNYQNKQLTTNQILNKINQQLHLSTAIVASDLLKKK